MQGAVYRATRSLAAVKHDAAPVVAAADVPGAPHPGLAEVRPLPGPRHERVHLADRVARPPVERPAAVHEHHAARAAPAARRVLLPPAHRPARRSGPAPAVRDRPSEPDHRVTPRRRRLVAVRGDRVGLEDVVVATSQYEQRRAGHVQRVTRPTPIHQLNQRPDLQNTLRFIGRKGIRPVKNRVVGCWRGYLSGARCRLAYGPADATATHCLLLQ